MLTDLEISQKVEKKPIFELAKEIGLTEDEIESYGRYKAKISLSVLPRLKNKPNGKYVVVAGITPTPFGEGKTVVAVGLAQALAKLQKSSFVCLRQPSMGPLFGVKGGGTGSGRAQIVPMEEVNLHLTGDIHAVSLAHNLIAAMIDASLFHGNTYNIDPSKIIWSRVVDLNDRALRKVKIGLSVKAREGLPRETQFDIAVASEIMAILALSVSIADFRKRLGKIVIGMGKNEKPITVEDLQIAGAVAALLKDSIKPNLLQTTEKTPAFIHTGPFANIAHGNSSIMADVIALKLADYVITESGFGTDCGFEKFVNIKCRISGLTPDAAVLVCSLRALKMHGGAFSAIPGKQLDNSIVYKENREALEKGCENLAKHIENIKLAGLPVVLAINRFPEDKDNELNFIKEKVKSFGVKAQLVEVWSKGGEGGVNLANAVIEACEQPNNFRFLYSLDAPIKEKIEYVATRIYGADGVNYCALADERIKWYTEQGMDKLPICIAKTHLSLSHDKNIKGRPSNFIIPIQDVRASIGAGFIVPIAGNIQTMPGLPKEHIAKYIDIDENGNVIGLR